ncbi:putative protein MTH_238 [Methanothermobacter wolfeii]|uniref:hypothetical protein n=1 Tax=Methanothermobacter wolfeii TaxID=145261 RepID=UPI00092D8390|nr:putative protein MTH_238 [Methanothermobacter wolfeii]
MFGIFGRKKEERNLIELEPDGPVDCIADFTYNFYWQHRGEKLDPDQLIPGTEYSYRDVVEHVRSGGEVRIKGDAGHRLASSMGADLKYFGGTGGSVMAGTLTVDGDVDTRMGISMVSGTIYVRGRVRDPIGNLIEVKSDRRGYKKFISVTDVLTGGHGGEKLLGATLTGNRMVIDDGHVRDTLGARLDADAEIVHKGDVDLSTGILMRKGTVRVKGDAGKNTGALLSGGTVIIDGDCDDFSGIDMRSGYLIVNGDAGKFMGAQRKGGVILARKGKPVPPTSENELTGEDKNLILKAGFNPQHFRRFS